jgi:hypothetical protein
MSIFHLKTNPKELQSANNGTAYAVKPGDC